MTTSRNIVIVIYVLIYYKNWPLHLLKRTKSFLEQALTVKLLIDFINPIGNNVKILDTTMKNFHESLRLIHI